VNDWLNSKKMPSDAVVFFESFEVFTQSQDSCSPNRGKAIFWFEHLRTDITGQVGGSWLGV
jgi:hypothetical protein